jgi:hypothetical protein
MTKAHTPQTRLYATLGIKGKLPVIQFRKREITGCDSITGLYRRAAHVTVGGVRHTHFHVEKQYLATKKERR